MAMGTFIYFLRFRLLQRGPEQRTHHSMALLSAQQRISILEYKYRGGDNSILYTYLLSPWAQYCVDCTPRWVAPNLITFVGLCFPFSAIICTLWFNPTLEADEPRWLCIWTAICLFVYQTMDNMDGKQARRTGSSSPLGMVFDHGCDAVNAVSMPLSVCGTLCTGWSVGVFLPICCAMVPFYFQTWEEYYSGEMIFPILNGPNEGLMMVVFMNFFTFVVGPMWWQTPIPIATILGLLPFSETTIEQDIVPGWRNFVSSSSYRSHFPPCWSASETGSVDSVTPFQIYASFGFILCVLCALEPFGKVLRCSKESNGGKFTIIPFLNLLPFICFMPSCMYFVYFSKVAFQVYPLVTMVAMGCSFVECVVHLMLAHITQTPPRMYERYPTWCMVIMALNIGLKANHQPIFDEACLLIPYAIWSCCVMCKLLYQVASEMADTLDVYIFVIGKRSELEKQK